jgi:hypothetical protein
LSCSPVDDAPDNGTLKIKHNNSTTSPHCRQVFFSDRIDRIQYGAANFGRIERLCFPGIIFLLSSSLSLVFVLPLGAAAAMSEA